MIFLFEVLIIKEVGIIGYGHTKFGSLGNVSSRELITSAGREAIEMAGSNPDAVYTGMLCPDIFEGQSHIAPGVTDALQLKNIPSTRVEAACASGGLAVIQSIIAVGSGYRKCVLAVGAEKMTSLSTPEVTATLAQCADKVYEANLGITFPGAFAIMARKHMRDFGTTREMMAEVSVKNHKNAVENEYAQFRKEISVDKVLNSIMIADPLTLYDCSPITDGAAAIIVVPWEEAKKIDGPKIRVRGFAQASDTVALHDRSDFTSFATTKIASRDAYHMAGITHKEIDFVEIHDCFSIAEIMAIEDMGFFSKGMGGQATIDGDTARDGTIPVNNSGGLKARGHPIGATGVSQVVEIFKQLNDMADHRQLRDAQIGMCQNLGGNGSSIAISIFGRD